MFGRFSQRSNQLERLDTGDYTQMEYTRWQREMWFVHRIFGEGRALRNSLLREIGDGNDSVSILDVGAGSGELLAIVDGWSVRPSPFLAGAELNESAANTIRDRGICSIQCNALRLPFADDGFDYVFCSLFLHHLIDERAVEVLREMRRVARKRIFVIDLHRSPVAYYFYKWVGKVLLQRFTLEDGSLSILRAFKPNELKLLAETAGLKDVKVRRSAACRLVLSGK